MENTVSNPEEQIIKEFRDQFSHPRIKDVIYINDNSLGSKNKGAGEYMMCRAAIEKHKDTLKDYDWIVYYTLRQIIVQPNTLEAIYEIEKSVDKKDNVIIGGLDGFTRAGSKTIAVKENYCDMIFAMKPETFVRYIDSMSPEELVAKKMSSENNLYDFVEKEVTDHKAPPCIRKRLGVLRYDYAINKTEIS